MNQTLDKVQIQNFLKLVRAPLLDRDGKMVIPELTAPDWRMMYKLARKHNVVNLGYEAVMRLPAELQPNEELLKQWRLSREQCTMQCIYQQAALEELISAFEENQIPFILLKGAVIRELYPRADLRSMSDLDILIREEDAKRAKKVVNALGYQDYGIDSRNEDVYRRDVVTVELHRNLFWKGDDWNAHFKKVWDSAKKMPEYSYCLVMNPEDFFAHMLGHIIHHMQNGGIGIKAFFDTWIYLNTYEKSWDKKYLTATLEKLNLLKFYNNLKILLEIWFGGESCDCLMDSWTEFIICSGAYGNFDNFVITNPALKDNSGNFSRAKKISYLWKRLFPDYDEMCNMFPGAKRGRFWYPYYAIKRIIKNGIFRHAAVKKEMKSIKEMDGKRIQNLLSLYRELGVDGITKNQ